MKKTCKIEINGATVDVIKEVTENTKHKNLMAEKIIKWEFYLSGALIGGMTKIVYDKKDSLRGIKMEWNLKDESKANRYYLARMEKLAHEQFLKEGE